MSASPDNPGYLVYTRLSAEEAVRGGMSLEVQEERCRDYASAQGIRVVDVFSDYGVSGRARNRPGFEAMCDALTDAQGLIVWKLDRLSRRVKDIYNFLERLRQDGREFVSVAERFDTTTAVGRGFLGMAAVFAELEAEQVAERVKEGNRHRASKGIWLYQAPFGYDYSTETKLLTAGDRAEDCAKVFRFFAEVGGNFSAAARRLNEQQLLSPKRRGWTAQGVKDIITNPVYRGTIRYVDVEGAGTWPAIIPAELLAEAGRLVEAQRHMPRGRTNQGKHPLSGRLRCHECGAPVIIQLRKRNGTVVLRCRSARHGIGCSQPGLAGRRLEQLWLFGLDKAWAEEKLDLGTVDLTALTESQGWVSPEERERRKVGLEAKRRRIIELRVEGHIGKDDMDLRLAPIAEELARLDKTAEDGDESAAAIEALVKDGIAPATAWGGMTQAEQRRLVGTLLRGPLEVELDQERRLRLHAYTWLYAERWEAWETRRTSSRSALPDQNGMLAYAVRAPD